MNLVKSYVFFILLSLLFTLKFSVHAQSGAIDSLLTKVLSTDELLPMLIDSAIKHSAEVRKSGSNITYANQSLQISKKAIFSAVSMGSSYNYGTNFSAVNNPAGSGSVNNFTTAQTGFYNLGIGIQLPLTHIINRKNIIKEGQSLVEAAVADKENTELLVKQEVIRIYQDFKLLQKLVMISSKNKESAEVNNVLAQKDFLNGQLTVDQVSSVQEKYNKSVIDFETNVIKFQTDYIQLEVFTGTNLSTLIRKLQ
jgi:outer membrane protein TolC